MPIAASLIRTRSGGLIAALFVSTLATGLIQIALPLELHRLRASPNEIGVTLSMFGVGLFLFEWLWGAVADRVGYRMPIIVAQFLYAGGILLLAGADTVPFIAVAYLVSSGMLVAAGPVGRSFIGTTLPPNMRATGLALLAGQWLIGDAIGAAVGGQLIERVSIHTVLFAASALPLVSAGLLIWVFRGYVEVHGRSTWTDEDVRVEASRVGPSVVRVLLVTAVVMILFQTGAGGETALLPLLVTTHLNLSAASAGNAMLAVGLLGGLLLVPGGMAADRWGRRRVMIAGGLISAAGFAVYALAGSFPIVILGAALRAVGGSLIWPAATAWISESSPRRRHALVMGLYGEFENVGVTAGPLLGGLVWSFASIQASFAMYAVAAFLAAVVCAAGVSEIRSPAKIGPHANADDRQPDRV